MVKRIPDALIDRFGKLWDRVLVAVCMLVLTGCAFPPPRDLGLGQPREYVTLAGISQTETPVTLILPPPLRSHRYAVSSVAWWGRTFDFRIGEYVELALPLILGAFYKNVDVLHRRANLQEELVVLQPEFVEFQLLTPRIHAGRDCRFSARIRLHIYNVDGRLVDTVEAHAVKTGPFPDAAAVAREAVDAVLIELISKADDVLIIQ